MALKSWFWPNVTIRKNALLAINEAFWVTIGVAGILAVWNVIEITRSTNEKVDYGNFLLAGVFGLAALGIWFKSRIAAIASFSLFVVMRLLVLFTSGPGGLVLSVVAGIALLQGVRGAIAYHQLPPIPVGTPSVANSFAAMKQTGIEPDQAKESDAPPSA